MKRPLLNNEIAWLARVLVYLSVQLNSYYDLPQDKTTVSLGWIEVIVFSCSLPESLLHCRSFPGQPLESNLILQQFFPHFGLISASLRTFLSSASLFGFSSLEFIKLQT